MSGDMSVAPVSGRVPSSVGGDHHHGRLACWAIALSAVFGAAFAASVGTIAIAYAVGAESAVEDNWLGALLAGTALVAVLGSLAAFVLAVVTQVRRERWVLLWLPLCVFPALVLFVVLGEAFWWE